MKRRWWENSGDFVGARMELCAPNGVRVTLLVASSFDGVDENGFRLGPPRRKERDLRSVPMRPEIDQRIVDAWLYGPTASGTLTAMVRVEAGSAAWIEQRLREFLTMPTSWKLSEGERVRLEDLPEVR